MDALKDLVPQNALYLPDAFRKGGCRARSLMAMAEFTLLRAMTKLQIQLAVATALRYPSVLRIDTSSGEPETAAGADEHKLTYYAFQLMGGYNRYCLQAGALKDGTFYDWQGNIIPKDQIVFSVLGWETDFLAGHWTLGDNEANELWDPWSEEVGLDPWDSTGTKPYHINKKRVVKAYAYKIFWGKPPELA